MNDNDQRETRIHWANPQDRQTFWAIRRELWAGKLKPGRAEELGAALVGIIERCSAGESIQRREP